VCLRLSLSCRHVAHFPVYLAAGDGDDVVSKYGLAGYEKEDEGIGGVFARVCVSAAAGTTQLDCAAAQVSTCLAS
jgi:hypothetical protein